MKKLRKFINENVKSFYALFVVLGFLALNNSSLVLHAQEGPESTPLIVNQSIEMNNVFKVTWGIQKDGAQVPGVEEAIAEYEVALDSTLTYLNTQVSGVVEITNPVGNPDAVITGVVLDTGSPEAPEIFCVEEYPYTLGAGESIECNYEFQLNSQDDVFAEVVVLTDGVVPGGSAQSQATNTGEPGQINDQCVIVTDSVPTGPQEAEVCFNDVNKTFFYEASFGPEGSDVPLECTGLPEIEGFVNEVSFTTNDTGTQDFASAFIEIEYQCEPGPDVFPLTVEQSVTGTTGSKVLWNIQKLAFEEGVTFFQGEGGVMPYGIALEPTILPVAGGTVSGNITVTNPVGNPSANVQSVSGLLNNIGSVITECDVELPYVLESGASFNCSYEAESNGTDSVSTVIVETTGEVPGVENVQGFEFIGDGSLIDECVVLNDSNPYGPQNVEVCIDLESPDSNYTFPYEATFGAGSEVELPGVCNEPVEYVNEATYVGVDTGVVGEAVATVSVLEKCVQELNLLKLNAWSSYDQRYDWSVEKTADKDMLVLGDGEFETVSYDVVLDAVSVDYNHKTWGQVLVENPIDNPPATIESIEVVLDGSGVVYLDCGVDLPYILGPNRDIYCTYEVDFADGNDTIAEVTVETSGLVPSNADQYEVQRSLEPEAVLGECADFYDPMYSATEQVYVCADELPKTISYAVEFGSEGEEFVCGVETHPNVASVYPYGGESAESTWSVEVVSACGCTLTQGYWKTHTGEGGAEFDEGWLEIGELGPDEEFAGSGLTWLQVFNTAPKGDAWYQLAHQWMAARLNILQYAPDSSVEDIMDAGYDWLVANAGTVSKDKTARMWATVLTGYNEGLLGPEHCDSVFDESIVVEI